MCKLINYIFCKKISIWESFSYAQGMSSMKTTILLYLIRGNCSYMLATDLDMDKDCWYIYSHKILGNTTVNRQVGRRFEKSNSAMQIKSILHVLERKDLSRISAGYLAYTDCILYSRSERANLWRSRKTGAYQRREIPSTPQVWGLNRLASDLTSAKIILCYIFL